MRRSLRLLLPICLLFFSIGCTSLGEGELEEIEQYVEDEAQKVLLSQFEKLRQDRETYAAVCAPFDIYDPLEKICYPPETCETVDDCALLGDELAEEIYEWFGDLLTDYAFDGDGDTFDEQVLARYQVEGDDLTQPQFVVVDEQLEPYRDAIVTHMAVWDAFRYLIPKKEREMVSGFTIFTDGDEEMLAQVEPDTKNVANWILGVDVVDAEESYILKTTLLHEYAHLLTLQQSQMDMDEEVLFADAEDPIHQTAAATCPYFQVDGMGCTKETSYLHQFYVQYWEDLIEEWDARDIATNEEEAEAFYEDYEDQFVTDYAVTSPDEDIAEVWTYFILAPRPAGDEIWEQKILFFYQYPEQVKLRAEVLSRLYSYLTLED